MAAYIVTYDLNRSGQDYKRIEAAIMTFAGYAQVATTTWIVIAFGITAVAIADVLRKASDRNDEIFVAELTRDLAWNGLGDALDTWIRENI